MRPPGRTPQRVSFIEGEPEEPPVPDGPASCGSESEQAALATNTSIEPPQSAHRLENIGSYLFHHRASVHGHIDLDVEHEPFELRINVRGKVIVNVEEQPSELPDALVRPER